MYFFTYNYNCVLSLIYKYSFLRENWELLMKMSFLKAYEDIFSTLN